MAILVQFQHRLDTAANWTSANPVLLAGELGLDTTVGRIKLGDGTTAWNSLLFQHTRILTGVGAPGAGIGADGDFYISTVLSIYGPKAGGAWPAGQTLVGNNGWSPQLAAVSNGSGGFVHQIIGWTGGTGTPPSSTNQFIGPSGIVGTAAAATDIRGPGGAAGTPGTNGAGFTAGGTTGQVTTKNSGTNYDVGWSNTPNDNTTLEVTGNNVLRVKAAGLNASYIAATTTARIYGRITAGAGPGEELTGAQVTSLLSLASPSAQGALSAADKKILDNLHYDAVADFGFVGNDSTDNASAWTTMIAALPVGASVFFPAGTYRTSIEFNINVDKRIRFYGSSRYNSIIKTTSTTANIFNITVPAWYNTFENLGFQSSVTKTAGYAIVASSGSAVGTNTYRCWATGISAIDLNGSQSGNLSVHNDWDISAVPNTMRGIRVNGAVINTMFHNITMNAGAATTSACLEVNQSGAVQVTACDWIMGTNVVLLNSTAGAGPQAVYITNCFFDQPQASCIRMIGTNTIGRVKLAQCGIATATSGFFGIEIAGTGSGAVGTQTALPAGISILDCDIYHQAGGSTGAGISINGAQDVNIQSVRIAGYSGAGGCGINATASTGGQTKLRINGCMIGPNSNLTILNETGVKLNSGNAFGALSVTDNSLVGNTIAITDASPNSTTLQKNINNNSGGLAGLSAVAPAGQQFLTTVETIVAILYCPPNSVKAGSQFVASFSALPGASSQVTAKLRIGANGVTPASDPAFVSVAGPAASAVAVTGMLFAGCLVSGATASWVGSGFVMGTTTTSAVTLGTTFNSAVANWVYLTLASGTSNTGSVRVAEVKCIGPV